MRYACALVLAALAALAPPAEAKVACDSGATAFVDGGLRIFGVHYRTPDEWGFEEYACLGRRRPLLVGGVGSSTGTGSGSTPVYARAGRFLAVYSQSDGEGGPSADVRVVDLIRRRTVSFADVACCEWTPALRLARDGTVAVLAPGEGLFVKAPGRRARTLAGEDAAPRDLAMHGGTVYWTEAGQARTATLPGVSGGEARALEPVRLRRRGGPCRAARGRTIAASGSVRVVERGDRRFLCRVGQSARIRLKRSSQPRIVADRWLLAFGARGGRVVDTRVMTTRYTVPGPVRSPTLLRDGTLLWIDGAGRLLRRGLFDAVVATMAGGPVSALAGARRVAYWTEDGTPRRYAPPRPARSASKPG